MSRIITSQVESRRRFKVGSQAFFEGMPGFRPSDTDEVEFEEQPRLYKNVLQFRKRDGTRCLFKWRKMSPEEFIEYELGTNLPMELGKFLVPEVADYLGFTLEHLEQLRPLTRRLDARHSYEKVIFDSYIENGGFWLTDEQRASAFSEYKKGRK